MVLIKMRNINSHNWYTIWFSFLGMIKYINDYLQSILNNGFSSQGNRTLDGAHYNDKHIAGGRC